MQNGLTEPERVQRAQEVIDRDPEEARDRLQAASNQQVTMADVMALMQQMTQMVTAAISGQQQQIEDLKQANRKPGEKTPWTPEDLERLNDQEQYLRDFWASEEQVALYIRPTAEEEKVRQAHKARLYPPRAFEVNGIKYWLKVGAQPPVPIPRSIADRIVEQQDGYRPIHNDAPQGLDSIPRPPRVYLASEAGRPGNLGEGPIEIHHLPAEPIGAR